MRCNVTRENEWIFALQQQQVLIPTLKIWAAGRSQKAEFATVQRPKTARNACKSESIRVLHAATGTNLNLKSKTQSQQAIDQVFWPKKNLKPVYSHFQYWHPFPVLSFFGFHFRKFSIWYGTQTRNLLVLVLGVTHSSHFRYWALPVPVRSFTGPRTGT